MPQQLHEIRFYVYEPEVGDTNMYHYRGHFDDTQSLKEYIEKSFQKGLIYPPDCTYAYNTRYVTMVGYSELEGEEDD